MKFTMFHPNDFVGLLVWYKVDLFEIDTNGLMYVAISGESYCVIDWTTMTISK